MKQYLCDKCGASGISETSHSSPKGWRELRISLTGQPFIVQQSKDLCPSCLTKLGYSPDSEEKQNTLDKLWDVMLDLAAEARDEV